MEFYSRFPGHKGVMGGFKGENAPPQIFSTQDFLFATELNGGK